MRNSRLWLVLLVIALAAAAAWKFGLLPQPGEGGRDGVAPAPAAIEDASSDAAADASRLAGSGATATPAPVVPPRPPIPPDMPRVTGAVVDRQGKGVAGARVISIPDTTTRTYFEKDVGNEGFPGFDATTDGDGRFIVALSKASTNQSLVVLAEGYAPQVKRDVAPGAEVRILLEKAGVLAGRVTNVESEPVVGAKVRVMSLLDVVRIEKEATSDAAGAYRIEGWMATTKADAGWQATYAIVTAAGYAPLFLDRVATAVPGGEARRDFVVVRGATVSGRVVEADTERPVAGVPVHLWSVEGRMYMGRARGQAGVPMPWGPRTLAETTSAADGTFRFEHVPSDGFHPLASHSAGRKGIVLGYVSAWVEGRAAASEEILAGADGSTIEVTLKLLLAGGIAGRVVDAAGKPVAGVSVYPRLAPGVTTAWIPKELYPTAPAAWAEPTGEDGRYRLPWIPIPGGAATDQLVEARARRDGDGMGGSRDPDGSMTVRLVPGVVVEAPDMLLLEGKAARDGEVAGIPIRVEDDRGAPVVGASVGWAAANGGQFQTTDAQGRASFYVMRLRPGQTVPPLRLVVRARGFAATPFSVPWTQAAPEPVVVRLARGHRLAGTVRQADGTPAVGASVRVANGTLPAADAFPEGTPDMMLGQDTPKPGAPPLVHYGGASTDEEGRFRIDDLPEGPYTVVVSGTPRSGAAAGFDAKPLRDVRPGVPTDASDLDLRLPVDDSPLPGSFEGTVVDSATKRPILRFTVQKEGGGGATRRVGSSMFFSQGLQVELTAPGRYEAVAVLPGTYALLVQAEGYVRARVPAVEVRSGDRTVVPRIELQRGLTLQGRVTLPAGVDASTLSLFFAHLEDETLSLTASLDATGRYERAGLVPGRWVARVQSTVFRPEGGAAIWAIEDGPFVRIAEGAGTTTRDFTLVPGAQMYVELSDARLPPGRMEGVEATPEQRAFGAGTSLRITAPDGTVLVDRKGVTRGWGAWSWHAVKPGRYVVRAEFPGGEVLEHAIDAEAGKEARLPGAPK